MDVPLALSLHAIDNAVRDWANGLGIPGEIVLRLVLAVLLGGLVGLEREVRGRQAGFRTNLLVCLGSAIVMVTSVSFAYTPWPTHAGFNLNVDPARVAYGVMGGVGFLGAGVIVKADGQVRGLTTAAGLWCMAAIGLACGLGLYSVSVISAALVVIALWSLNGLEKALPRVRYRVITVRRAWHPGVIGETVRMIKAYETMHVSESKFERIGDLSTVDITLRVAFRSREQYYKFEQDLDTNGNGQLISSSEP
ncbi:MAG: MgtC/SapB family protein [Phycisphaerae bacterium]|nr:MgtC/SapB family protein [Tepidisphaeraceae bacterium]